MRALCFRCRRPESVCYCAHLTSIPTETRVVLLQHPRERDVAIGTARMASLCLPNAEIHVGVDWEGSPALERALSQRSHPPILLYPGEGALDVREHPPTTPVTLVVVDGTWWQTKKLLKTNPTLRALPRYAFKPPRPSEYRIRREPDDGFVSTIEALMHVLGALEGDADRFSSLMAPFRAMIDAQIACQTLGRKRGRGPRKPRPEPRPHVPDALRHRLDDVVCVMGEANAFSYRDPLRATHGDALVHWVACRLRTGEVFDAVIAPEAPLADATPHFIELDPALIERGEPLSEALSRWRAFVQPTDLICSWGHYAAGLLLRAGGFLPADRIDLRQVARDYARGKVGTIEEFASRVAAEPTERRTRGRGGRRLEQLVAIARRLSQ